MSPEEAKQYYKEYGSIRAASKASGVPRTSFRRLLKKGGYEDRSDETDDLTLKLRRQEKTIQNLSRELKKAQDQLLTNQEVRKYILGIRELDDGKVPSWTVEKPEYSIDDNIPVSILSDVHAGEVVDPKQVFGLNEYNLAIMQERLSMYVNNIFWLLEDHLSPRDYPGFVFCLGGDMIAGNIHQELSETNEQQVMPVLLDLYQNLKYVIEILADKFGKLFIPCVYGNHGRTNKKPQHKSQAYKNFDWLLYHLLADSFQEDDRINFLIGDDDEVQFQVANTVYRLTHGAQLTGGSGFIGPLAPIIRGEKKKNIVAQTQSLPYDVLLMGHFHQTLWMPRTVVNGSLVGYSEYAADKNLEYEHPKQMLWLTDPNFGKVSPMEVYCDNVGTQVQSLKQVVF